jgi:hypothetical protein
MTQITIEESKMVFGPFEKTKCFHIEKSFSYAALCSGIPTVEFILIQNDKQTHRDILSFIEAKSSVPKFENRGDFQEFLVQIKDKFAASASLCTAQILGRFPDKSMQDELPAEFRKLPSTTAIRLILVIKGYPDTLLADLTDKLKPLIDRLLKPWGLKLPIPLLVLNDAKAQKMGLVSEVLQ